MFPPPSLFNIRRGYILKNNTSGVYKIINKKNGKVYIGSSIDLPRRERDHFRTLKGGYHGNIYLQNSFDKNGEDSFEFKIIETIRVSLDKEKMIARLLEIEQHWIDYYKSYKNKNGYNIQSTAGRSNLGVKFSVEQRQRMRESQKSSRPIYQIDFEGNIVRKWEYGASEASKRLGIGQANIFKCLHKKRKTYKNYIWIFVEEHSDFNLKNHLQKNKRPVIQTDLFDNFIRRWESISEIEREMGIAVSMISRVCRKERAHTHNFKWIYEEEYDKIKTG